MLRCLRRSDTTPSAYQRSLYLCICHLTYHVATLVREVKIQIRISICTPFFFYFSHPWIDIQRKIKGKKIVSPLKEFVISLLHHSIEIISFFTRFTIKILKFSQTSKVESMDYDNKRKLQANTKWMLSTIHWKASILKPQ